MLSVVKSPRSTTDEGSLGRKIRTRVLLVEDDDDLRYSLEQTLRQVGYAVISVPNGQRALQLARHGAKFDLLLTDLRMPGEIDGAKLAAEIQTLRPNVAVVFSTGCVEEEIKITRRFNGPNAFLIKPYTRKQMETTLAAVTSRLSRS